MQLVRISPVHPAKPVCSSFSLVAASVPPAELPVSAAHCSAVPAAEAPQALPALVSEEEKNRRLQKFRYIHAHKTLQSHLS